MTEWLIRDAVARYVLHITLTVTHFRVKFRNGFVASISSKDTEIDI